MKATARDMRFHAGTLLEAAANGEEVTITYHGKAKAKLVSVETNTVKEPGPAFGMWKDRDDIADPAEYVREKRRSRFQ